jgi:hypothetical protein
MPDLPVARRASPRAGTGNASIYEIDACSSLRFEPKGYIIPVPEELGVDGPNSIHVIHRSDDGDRV